jgi:hypothetical protein
MNDMQLTPIGRLDLISDEGWVVGWAWYPDAPERRVEVDVLADGDVIGTMTANLHREDVKAAGCGDGCYGFSIALPYQVLSSSRPTAIVVHDRASGAALTKPVIFSQPALREASTQLDALTQDVKLLSASLVRLQAKEAADNHATAALFRTVADFFSQLADVTLAGGSPRTLRTLHNAVAETTREYRQLDFTPAASPAVSVCFVAGSDMEAMYASLASVQHGFADARAEMLILDPDDSADAPLLPLLASNARYMRLARDAAPASCLNALAQAAQGEILCFVTSPVVLSRPWLTELATAFTDPKLAVLAVRLVGADGVVEHAGAWFDRGMLRARDTRSDIDPTVPATVEAAGGQIFVVRRESWRALGGFDVSFATMEATVAAFCLRAGHAGMALLYTPHCEALSATSPMQNAEHLAQIASDMAKLRDMKLALAAS